jgi:hypothetical protein
VYLKDHLELLEYFQVLFRSAATAKFEYPANSYRAGEEKNVEIFLMIAEIRYVSYLNLLLARKSVELLPPWYGLGNAIAQC